MVFFQRPVSETSSLLHKSLSNGSLPSAEDLHNDFEVQLSVVHKKGRQGTPDVSYKRNLLVMSLGALLTILFLIGSSSIPMEDTTATANGGNWQAAPLSKLDPVRDLNLGEHGRPKTDPSFPAYYYGFDDNDHEDEPPFVAQPTNAWYQNMLQAAQHEEPANLQRIYPGPYLMDVVGLIPGLRIHPSDTVTNDMVMQLTFNEHSALVLGAAERIGSSTLAHTNRYKVLKTTDLGITLGWEAANMTANIVKGMSFVTMEYDKDDDWGVGNTLLPTISSRCFWQNPVLVDGIQTSLNCSEGAPPLRVENDMELYFPESDYSWMAFFSEPVMIQCSVKGGQSMIQVVGYDEEPMDGSCASPAEKLVIRVALIDQCTNGVNGLSCEQGLGRRLPDEPRRWEYVSLLRGYADTYPGPDTSFSYKMPEEGDNEAELIFNWDPQRMSDLCHKDGSTDETSGSANGEDMLAFALPHQIERMPSTLLPNTKRYCKSTLTGPACLVKGTQWRFPLELPEVDFRAKRPPKPEYIPTLGKALMGDIEMEMPWYFKKGAGDTYFSGKLLAKLARILLIAEEVDSLCGEEGGRDYMEICQNSTLPSDEQFQSAIQELREGVEIWINGTAITPFVYDTSWGGVVSCGCYMNEHTECINRYPNCPAFSDPGLNFGNGFYNDHHFHYGYHIFSAAVVAHYDPEWGKENFENVLLLVRDIANPSEEDTHFPLFRHKDWYMGSSWASGISYPAYLNGKNQESSSEAIAAYEGVALYGQVMTEIWQDANDEKHAETSKRIAHLGRLLAGTEIVSAQRYWHVPDDRHRAQNQERIYPEGYHNNVIGILWQNMAQFGTWFGAETYLPIGIQLLPLTPISEDRDDVNWINSIYEPLTESCAKNFDCTESGWSILQIATLATIGYAPEAARKLTEVPDQAFENAGGNGHSRSNTLWYIATRPAIADPIPMARYDKRGEEDVQPRFSYVLKDCHVPETCTDKVLDRQAGGFTCRERIEWMIHSEGLAQWEACYRVAGLEFPNICGECNPNEAESSSSEEEQASEEEDESSASSPDFDLQCPPCTERQCNSDLNRCPFYERTFVCTEGTSMGACSGDFQIWTKEEECNACCEMTGCFDLKDNEAEKFTKDGNALTIKTKKSSCPPCKAEVCYSELNQCQAHTAPYLCTGGLSIGGCASAPWDTSDMQCTECCEVKLDC